MTDIVTSREAFQILYLQPTIDSFHSNVQKKNNRKNYSLNSILNTDRNRCAYEYASERTPGFQGSKDVATAFKGQKKTTHLYTIQITISAAGMLVGKVFFITQEPRGKFGYRVGKKLEEMRYDSVVIV